MHSRLNHLYLYVQNLYQEYQEELKAMGTNTQRRNFLLSTVEEDLSTITANKQQFYKAVAAGLSFSQS